MTNKIKSFIQVNGIYAVWFEKDTNSFFANKVNFACLCEDADGEDVVKFMDVVCCNKDGEYYIDEVRKHENFAGYYNKEELDDVDAVRFDKFDTSAFKPMQHS